MLEKTPQGLSVAGRVAMIFATLPAVFAVAGLTPILVSIQAHFASDPNSGLKVRLLLTAVSASMIIASPLVGYLADRFGKRWLLMVALFLYGLFGALGAIENDLNLMIATRFLLGLTGAAISTLSLAILSDAFEGAERSRWLGYYVTVGTIGGLVLVPLAGWLGSMSWRAPFLLHLLALPLLLLTAVGIPGGRSSRVQTFDQLKSVGGLPYGLMILGASVGAGISAAGLFLPFHLANIGIATPTAVAGALLPAAIGGAVISFAYGWIRKRATMATVFLLAFPIAGIGLMLSGFAQAYPVVVLAQAITGIGIGLLSPNLYAIAAQTGASEHRARNIGFARSSFYLGPIVAQIILEPIADRYSPGVALIVLGVCTTVAALHAFGPGRETVPQPRSAGT